MSEVGINEAARLTGKNKATISRDTKSGKLSANVNEGGQKRYQVAELERVYGTLRTPDTGYAPLETHRPQPVTAVGYAVVSADVVEAKEEVISLLKSQVEDLRRERDHWREQAVRMLPAPAEAVPQGEAAHQTVKRGIWPFRRKVALQ